MLDAIDNELGLLSAASALQLKREFGNILKRFSVLVLIEISAKVVSRGACKEQNSPSLFCQLKNTKISSLRSLLTFKIESIFLVGFVCAILALHKVAVLVAC